MNRKVAATYLSMIIDSHLNDGSPVFLTEPYLEAIKFATNELERCCANCAHKVEDDDGNFLCGLDYSIINEEMLNVYFCAYHETNEPF